MTGLGSRDFKSLVSTSFTTRAVADAQLNSRLAGEVFLKAKVGIEPASAAWRGGPGPVNSKAYGICPPESAKSSPAPAVPTLRRNHALLRLGQHRARHFPHARQLPPERMAGNDGAESRDDKYQFNAGDMGEPPGEQSAHRQHSEERHRKQRHDAPPQGFGPHAPQ